MPTSILPISEVLKDVTRIKIEEFEKATANFKRRYEEGSVLSATDDNTLMRVTALLEQIKTFDPYLEDGQDLKTMTRYLKQAKNDRSISQTKLEKFEKQLRDKLEIHCQRLDVSSLHMSLLKAAMNSSKSQIPVSADFEMVTIGEDFDMVEDQLGSAFENFEKHTFKAKEVKVDELEKYLASLFEDEAGERALGNLRVNIDEYGTEIMDGDEEVDEDIVEWCIKDLLLRNTLLSDMKRATLQDYLQSPAAIREMARLLNGKSIRNWNWRNAEKGLSVTVCQNPEGEYCITIEEDIVDMLFLHALAMGWSMKVKVFLNDMVSDCDVWGHGKPPSLEEMAKRDYYLRSPRPQPRSVPRKPKAYHYLAPPPPPPCPPPPPMIYSGPPPPPPPPPPSRRFKSTKRCSHPYPGNKNLNVERHKDYMREFFLSRLPKGYEGTAEVTSVDDTQSKLMKHIAAEAKLREALDGEAHGLAANLEYFASSLPHKTILILLKFIGVPQQWLEVFTRFLEAPLNMGPLGRESSDQILKRACGVPVGHGMELFFGELVLFFLDFIVHRETGGYLYRLRDKCYFVGKAEQCLVTRETMAHFSDLAGLNLSTTSSLAEESIGFLKFGIQEGKPVTFSIDNDKVEAYARRAKKQLDTCATALDWMRMWNSTMGKYASHLFGPLANVFGAPHLEAVTQAYNRMHTIIFEASNLTACLTQLLVTHVDPFAPKPSHLLDPSTLEALIYLPAFYGGFGVKNPYTTLNLARELPADPSTPLRTYMSEEKTYYKNASDVFATFSAETRAEKLETLPWQCSHADILNNRNPADFFTFEECTQNREQVSYPYLASVSSLDLPSEMPSPFIDYGAPPSILSIYTSLLKEPYDGIQGTRRVHDEVQNLAARRGINGWWRLSWEERWAVQMYGDECLELYGGLEVWCEGSMPREVLVMMRGDLYNDVYDDDDSNSDVTEV